MTKLGIPGIAPALEAELTEGMAKVESLLLSHIQGDYPLVEETSRHLVAAGGKRLRPLLTLLASQYGDKNKFGIIESAVVCELTHVATLYHDDVMDEATLRRGVESANHRWGNTVAILTGDYLFAKVSALLADIGPEAVRLQLPRDDPQARGARSEARQLQPRDGAGRLQGHAHVIHDQACARRGKAGRVF